MSNPAPKPRSRRARPVADRIDLPALRRLYERGASIRQLADHNRIAYATCHRLLLEAGATLRKRGASPKPRTEDR